MAQLYDRILLGVELNQRPLLLHGSGEAVRLACERWLDLTIAQIGPRYHCLARLYRLLAEEAALRRDTAAAVAWLGKGRQLNLIPGAEAALVLADLHDTQALIWAGRRDFRQAFLELELADQLTRRQAGDRHRAMADRWHHYAQVCVLQGDFKTAHDYFDKALKHQSKILGEAAPRNALILLNWGRLSMRQQQYVSAERTLEQAGQLLAAAPAGAAPWRLELALLRLELARQQRQPRQTLDWIERAQLAAGCRRDSVALREGLLREQVAVWRGQHRPVEALAALREWRDFRSRHLLTDPLTEVDIRREQGELLTQLGQYAAAGSCLRHAAAWYAELCPADANRLWAGAQARIEWALAQGRTSEALQLLTASVDLAAREGCRRARWAALHAEASERSGRLADWLETARYGLGEALAARCTDEQLLLYESLGRAEAQAGDFATAKPLLLHVLVSRELQGERLHPQCARVYRSLAEGAMREGSFTAAEAHLQEGRRVALAVYGDRHISAADLLVIEAQLARARGQSDRFMSLAVEAWALYDRLPPLPSPYRVRLNLLLADWYASQGEVERADRYLGYALRSPVGQEELRAFFAQPGRRETFLLVHTLGLVRALTPDAGGRKRSSR
jgi:Tfp pilus assembly protein PilF